MAIADPTLRRRAIDPLDTDLLAALQEWNERLHVILNEAMRYRKILTEQVQRLRAGDAPELARAVLARWDTTLQEIKRVTADL